MSRRYGLKPADFRGIESFLCVATNSQLYKIKEMVEKEIRLSETAIQEGFEKVR